jgi:hypothetical protein
MAAAELLTDVVKAARRLDRNGTGSLHAVSVDQGTVLAIRVTK